MGKRFQVTFDAADPRALGRFWAEVLGYVEQPPPPPHGSWDEALEAWGVPEDQRDTAYAIVDPDGVGPRVYLQKVPEPKVAKNRVHLDVPVSAGPDRPPEERRAAIEPEIARLEGLGATLVRIESERGEWWAVLSDPEGNEFCLV